MYPNNPEKQMGIVELNVLLRTVVSWKANAWGLCTNAACRKEERAHPRSMNGTSRLVRGGVERDTAAVLG
jgi:hypothetical protein